MSNFLRLLIFSFGFILLLDGHLFGQSKAFSDGLKKVYAFEENDKQKEAKATFLSLKNSKQISAEEKKFIGNYILLLDYKLSEGEDIKNIETALKNVESIKNRKPHETTLLLNLFTETYHHIAYAGDWAKALDIAIKGSKIIDFGQALLETRTDYLYDLGYLYDTNQKNFEAINYYKTSLGLYIRQFGEVSTHTALTYNNLAYAYTEVGNEKNAIAYYKKAASIWEKVHQKEFDSKDYLITVYQNLTYQYLNYGDVPNAQKAADKLNGHYIKKYWVKENQKLDTYFDAKKSYVLNNIRIALANNNIPRADKLLRDLSLDSHFSYKSPDDIKYYLQASHEIAEKLIETKKLNEAIVLSNKNLDLALKCKSDLNIVVSLSNLAKIYRISKDYQKTLYHADEAIKNLNPTHFSSSYYTLRSVKANAFMHQKKYDLATKETRQCLETLVLKLTRKKKPLEKIEFKDVKEAVSLNFVSLFTKSGETYLNQYKIKKNKRDLILAEKLYMIASKLFYEYYQKGEYNQTLSDYHAEIIEGLLETASAKKLSNAESKEYLNTIELNSSQHLLKEYLKKAYKPDNANMRTASQIKDLESELYYYQNLENLDKNAHAKNQETIAEIEKKISALVKKTSKTYQAIREVSVSNFDIEDLFNTLQEDETIVKYYLGSSHVYAVHISPNNIEIKNLGTIDLLKTKMESFLEKTKAINADFRVVAKDLYKSLEFNVSTPKVTIIPDGFLSYLPFEALISPKTNDFVVKTHRLSYDYSLSIWLFNNQKGLSIDNQKLIAFSPKYNSEQVSMVRAGLADLKFAKEEAAVISKLFGGESVLNNEATKERFLNSIDKYGIFHFSMHSQLFQDDFNKSCLVFSNNERLFFSELYGLNFPAKMAVLSACDTGNGVLKSGEGIMSLSRALTYAGVQSSVYSLWQVPDKETSEIIIEFYKNLKNGQQKDEALSNAKNAFISKNPLKSHPYFWAGFVVNGNMEPLETMNYWLWVLLGIIGFVAVFWIFKIKK
jgi:CHAT domain-containing protein